MPRDVQEPCNAWSKVSRVTAEPRTARQPFPAVAPRQLVSPPAQDPSPDRCRSALPQPDRSALPDTLQCLGHPSICSSSSATTHPVDHPIRVQPCVTPGCEHAAHPLETLHRMVIGVAGGRRRTARPGASTTRLAGAPCAYKERLRGC